MHWCGRKSHHFTKVRWNSYGRFKDIRTKVLQKDFFHGSVYIYFKKTPDLTFFRRYWLSLFVCWNFGLVYGKVNALIFNYLQCKINNIHIYELCCTYIQFVWYHHNFWPSFYFHFLFIFHILFIIIYMQIVN